MIKRIDRYIVLRLFTITVFTLMVLIFIFLVIDFSENSDDFTDHGATFAQIFGIYYLNYIPEIIRLVTPIAIFVACLYLTGQMADRLEITALKAAGVSLYRLLAPYLVFAFVMMCTISYLDGFVIPDANSKRIAFEEEYLSGKSQKVDNNHIYRQESPDTIFRINYFKINDTTGFRVEMIHFKGDTIDRTLDINQMQWNNKSRSWRLFDVDERIFTGNGYRHTHYEQIDTTLNILPRDISRTTSDIYQLTYPEAQNYIESIRRSGASGHELPQIQFYGRVVYPFSIVVVIIVGFAIAAERRKGGKGFHIAAGLTISFLYLALMKVIEPFGSQGEIQPLLAAALPHIFFLLVGLGLLTAAKK